MRVNDFIDRRRIVDPSAGHGLSGMPPKIPGSTHFLFNIDPEFFHPFPDGHPADTQHSGGLGLVAAGLAKHVNHFFTIFSAVRVQFACHLQIDAAVDDFVGQMLK